MRREGTVNRNGELEERPFEGKEDKGHPLDTRPGQQSTGLSPGCGACAVCPLYSHAREPRGRFLQGNTAPVATAGHRGHSQAVTAEGPGWGQEVRVLESVPENAST